MSHQSANDQSPTYRFLPSWLLASLITDPFGSYLTSSLDALDAGPSIAIVEADNTTEDCVTVYTSNRLTITLELVDDKSKC